MSALGYFVAGTDTEIGKTLIASSLIRMLVSAGIRTAAMKPVAAGAELRDGEWHNDDCAALAAEANVPPPRHLTNPYLFQQPTAPHLAAALEGRSIELPPILDCYRQVADLADAVVVEGVGGFRVPLDRKSDTADLAQQLGLPIVLVVGLRLGCINHALLTVEAIATRGLQLAGWVANTIDPDMLNAGATVDAVRDRIDAPLLGWVPRLAPANGAAMIAAALEHLDFCSLLRTAGSNASNPKEVWPMDTASTPELSATTGTTTPPGKAQAWPLEAVLELFNLPFNDLLFRAQQVHRQHFDPNEVELATLLSIKTGGCPEDCGYCPQAARYNTGVAAQKILPLDTVLEAAREAQAQGATRFCMGAAWRQPKDRDLEHVEAMVRGVKALGLETCATLGMLGEGQAERLKQAGLDYYNHNLDTAPEIYGDIVTTRDYQDRLDTLENVRSAGINVCCGGIVGMGESRAQRAGLVAQLANMTPYPESVPINNLVQVEGTPLHGAESLDFFEFVRTIAVARITMPKARVRLSAGRREMGEAFQALSLLAGANSIFYGDLLLTTGNPHTEEDRALLAKLGLQARVVPPRETEAPLTSPIVTA